MRKFSSVLGLLMALVVLAGTVHATETSMPVVVTGTSPYMVVSGAISPDNMVIDPARAELAGMAVGRFLLRIALPYTMSNGDLNLSIAMQANENQWVGWSFRARQLNNAPEGEIVRSFAGVMTNAQRIDRNFVENAPAGNAAAVREKFNFVPAYGGPQIFGIDGRPGAPSPNPRVAIIGVQMYPPMLLVGLEGLGSPVVVPLEGLESIEFGQINIWGAAGGNRTLLAQDWSFTAPASADIFHVPLTRAEIYPFLPENMVADEIFDFSLDLFPETAHVMENTTIGALDISWSVEPATAAAIERLPTQDGATLPRFMLEALEAEEAVITVRVENGRAPGVPWSHSFRPVKIHPRGTVILAEPVITLTDIDGDGWERILVWDDVTESTALEPGEVLYYLYVNGARHDTAPVTSGVNLQTLTPLLPTTESEIRIRAVPAEEGDIIQSDLSYYAVPFARHVPVESIAVSPLTVTAGRSAVLSATVEPVDASGGNSVIGIAGGTSPYLTLAGSVITGTAVGTVPMTVTVPGGGTTPGALRVVGFDFEVTATPENMMDFIAMPNANANNTAGLLSVTVGSAIETERPIQGYGFDIEGEAAGQWRVTENGLSVNNNPGYRLTLSNLPVGNFNVVMDVRYNVGHNRQLGNSVNTAEGQRAVLAPSVTGGALGTLIGGQDLVQAGPNRGEYIEFTIPVTNASANAAVSFFVERGGDSGPNALPRMEIRSIAVIPVILRGDVNGDGQINILDLTLLRLRLTNPNVEVDEYGANANGEGGIDQDDVTALRRILVGLI